MVSTKFGPYLALSVRIAEIRLTMTGLVGFLKSVSPVWSDSEWPSKSMSRPSRPHLSMIAETELTNVSRAAVVVSCTWPFWPPIEISTFLPLARLAAMAALKSASDSTVGHSVAGQRLNRMSPEVTEVGSPKERLMKSHESGTSATLV